MAILFTSCTFYSYEAHTATPSTGNWVVGSCRRGVKASPRTVLKSVLKSRTKPEIYPYPETLSNIVHLKPCSISYRSLELVLLPFDLSLRTLEFFICATVFLSWGQNSRGFKAKRFGAWSQGLGLDFFVGWGVCAGG